MRIEQRDWSSPKTHTCCPVPSWGLCCYHTVCHWARVWLVLPHPVAFSPASLPSGSRIAFTLNLPASAAKLGQGTENQHSYCPGCHTSLQSLHLSTVSVTSHPPSLPVSSRPISLPPSLPQLTWGETRWTPSEASFSTAALLLWHWLQGGWCWSQLRKIFVSAPDICLGRTDVIAGWGRIYHGARCCSEAWELGHHFRPPYWAVLGKLVLSCASVSLKNGNDYAGHLCGIFWLIRKKDTHQILSVAIL